MSASADQKLTSPRVTRELLQRHGIHPRKRWGQHFLCDENVLHKIVEAAELAPQDHVFEIGPGLGVLTEQLAQQAREVIAVEIDERFLPILRERLTPFPNVKILHGDVLQIDWSTLFPAEVRAKAIGNLPYSITSPLLEKFIEHRQRFERAVWTLQLEVAQKVTAPPGTRASSSLGVFVQAFCETKLLFRVSKRSFWPPPEVDSAVVQLFPLEKPRFKAPEEAFLRIVRAAFGLRRKTLLRALTLSPHVKLSTEQARAILRQASIAESRRGETLTLEEFDRLAQELAQMENSA